MKDLVPRIGTDPEVVETLKGLAQQNRGLLTAQDVLDEARKESSPLHDKFEWDDDAAAEKFRLIQARVMISVSVQYIKRGNKSIQTKVFVNLKTDRIDGRMSESAGYRLFDDVMANADLKNQLLMESLDQMTHFEQKYKSLQELGEVFSAMGRVKGTIKKRVKGK